MIALFITTINHLFSTPVTTTTPAVVEPAPEYFYSSMWGMKFHVSELEFAGCCEGVARYHVCFGREFTGMVVYEDQLVAA